MSGKRPLFVLFLGLILPLLVAALDWPVWAAILAVLGVLFLYWMARISAFLRPARLPELELETISGSHFVEKVRWCMDRLGVDYHERAVGGVLGVLFTGRSVPRLHFTTGIARSSIGNSAEILRYLWGRYGHVDGMDAEFLQPSEEREQLEARIDRIGVDFQIWVYTFLLEEKDLCLRAWGARSPRIPSWQRTLMTLLFPFTRRFMRFAFKLSPSQYDRAVDHVNGFLQDVELLLADGRDSLLGGDGRNYTDYAFCAINGLWCIPPAYGGGQAEEVRYRFDELPSGMQDDITNWRTRFPLATAFIEKVYAEERTRPLA